MRDGLCVPLYPAGRCVSRAENTLKLIKARKRARAIQTEREGESQRACEQRAGDYSHLDSRSCTCCHGRRCAHPDTTPHFCNPPRLHRALYCFHGNSPRPSCNTIVSLCLPRFSISRQLKKAHTLLSFIIY